MTDHANIHIYAQDSWHDNAHIVGTVDGLRALRDTLNHILETPAPSGQENPLYPEHMTVFANDGEGYHLYVHRLPIAMMDAMAPPYIGDAVAMRQYRDTRLTPEDLRTGGRLISAQAHFVLVPPDLYTPTQHQRRAIGSMTRRLAWILEADMVPMEGDDSRPLMRCWTDTGDVTGAQRDYARGSDLYQQGDLRLVWVRA